MSKQEKKTNKKQKTNEEVQSSDKELDALLSDEDLDDILSTLKNKNQDSKPAPPLFANTENCGEIISTIREMDYDFNESKHENLVFFQYEDEFSIVIDETNNEITLLMNSLMCPQRVFILSKELFENDIKITYHEIFHVLPNKKILYNKEACNGREALMAVVHDIPDPDETFLKSLSEKKMTVQ